MMTAREDSLRAMANAPEDAGAFETWLGQADLMSFLADDAADPSPILYAGFSHLLIHAVLVPRSAVDTAAESDWLHWQGNPWSSWGVVSHRGAADEIVPPLAEYQSKPIEAGEQLVFGRSFDGVPGHGSYIELNQRFAHVLGLHFMPERRSWCRLDMNGDIAELVRWRRLNDDALVTCSRGLLAEYASLTDSVLARMFESTRFRTQGFGGWDNGTEEVRRAEPGIVYRWRRMHGASASWGIQLLDLANEYQQQKKPVRQYASFIAHDWKHSRIAEVSCDPGQLDSYFAETGKPYETTPAFFRPEVLAKYKADNEKYQLAGRTLSCRGSWHLQTYDVNEAGQVHTYLIYLSRLPYNEQLYWKSFNEEPKGPISARALQTDFNGEWSSAPDPLDEVRYRLGRWNKRNVPWWTLRAANLPGRVHYPVTASSDEWANALLALDQLVVEGFEERWLRSEAARLGDKPQPEERSLALLGRVLRGRGLQDSEVAAAQLPLRRLHQLRSIVGGHAAGETARDEQSCAINEYGSLAAHFRDLCAQCSASLGTVEDALGPREQTSAED